MRRAAEGERANLTSELAGVAAPADDDGAADLGAFEATLADAQAAQSVCASDLAAARAALGEARAAAGALELELETTAARRERAQHRLLAVGAERERLAAEAAAVEAAQAALSPPTQRPRTRRVGAAAAALAAAEAAADAAADEASSAALALSDATSAWRQIAAERAGVEADLDHAGASLAELREVDADVLRIAEGYPGVVELSSAVRCERGFELALGAALAQHPGTLAVASGADQWPLLQALRAAGVRMARLLVPSRARERGAGAPLPARCRSPRR